MSDSIRFTSDGSTVVGGITVNTPYEDKKDVGVKVEDFLQLMIAQLQNQDFMNPVDDTQYVTQLAQFATMQSMQDLAGYSQTNYAMSLVGKQVTVASYGLGGQVNKDVGIVSKVNFSGDEYYVTVNGKDYKLSQIMYVNDTSSDVTKNELEAAQKMPLIQKEVGSTKISLRWEAPVSEDKQGGLTYDVYYSTTESNFNDLQTVKKGTAIATGLKDPEYELTGLAPGTRYFINVVVRNANGDESVYQMANVTTKSA